MNELKEIAIKNALTKYIRHNFILEGHPDLINDKVIYLAVGLYDLFESFNPNSNPNDRGNDGELGFAVVLPK